MKCNRPGLVVCVTGLILGSIAGAIDINHDIAIAYSAGLKLLSGQSLYVNFSEPHGPITSWIFALFLLVTPTGGWAMILASGILNALASWLAWRLVSLTRDCQDAPLLAGLMTSFWYLPVFGTYYHDHLAFLFVLLGFLFYLEAHGNLCRIALAALFFFAAYHAKQTVGATGMLSLAVAILIFRGREAFRDRYNYYLLFIIYICII